MKHILIASNNNCVKYFLVAVGTENETYHFLGFSSETSCCVATSVAVT